MRQLYPNEVLLWYQPQYGHIDQEPVQYKRDFSALLKKWGLLTLPTLLGLVYVLVYDMWSAEVGWAMVMILLVLVAMVFGPPLLWKTYVLSD